jgi:peptide deformylase
MCATPTPCRVRGGGSSVSGILRPPSPGRVEPAPLVSSPSPCIGAAFFCYSRIMLPILQKGESILATTAEPVPHRMFGTLELQKMIADMTEALDAEADGVAIAAPQVGIPYRIFLVRYDRMTPPPHEEEPVRAADLGVYINPEIVRTSRRRDEMDEGCLSVRGVYGVTLRHDRATVRAQDVSGASFERGGGGILAQAFQHEIDHLDGILFVDHAQHLREIAKEQNDAA